MAAPSLIECYLRLEVDPCWKLTSEGLWPAMTAVVSAEIE